MSNTPNMQSEPTQECSCPNTKLPLQFSDISIAGLEAIEKRSIDQGNNKVRFMLRRAVLDRSIGDQRGIMQLIRNDPTWIEPPEQTE